MTNPLFSVDLNEHDQVHQLRDAIALSPKGTEFTIKRKHLLRLLDALIYASQQTDQAQHH